ncbi:Hypothetical protein PHPALM_7577 [Phytophthora palmivora]|uniref:Uncharacterized protein n=1 Tax=Phytophthora palmivora TaxID=4796 RepID=A0A2P4YC08_9STRA|nr:Hypothetical protein PHPALM_7577 [Phytophthora palmivora]
MSLMFMRKSVEVLVWAGLCYSNPHGKWCSPPLIVRKPDVNDFRMTVDVRAVSAVSAQTERIL